MIVTPRSLANYILDLIVLSLVLAVLVSLSPALYSTSLAAALSAGCDGYIMVHKDAGDPDPIYASFLELPGVGLFHLHAYAFDPGNTVEWVIRQQTGDLEVLVGTLTILADGTGQTGQLHLPNGAYTVSWHQAGCPAGDKFQAFTVERQQTDPAGTVASLSNHHEIVMPSSAVTDRQAQVAVLCQGCWSSSAQVWVGGTEQPSQLFAPDAVGTLAALWTFWNDKPWQIRVRVLLPTELDANRWKLILWVGTGPQDYIWADETTFNLGPHELVTLNFQLVDTYSWQ